MTAKGLKDPALRSKFRVGDRVVLPREVWHKLTVKACNLPRVEHVVASAGDTIVQHGKNRLCRFAITLGEGTTTLMTQTVIWEEWMLQRITVAPASQEH